MFKKVIFCTTALAALSVTYATSNSVFAGADPNLLQEIAEVNESCESVPSFRLILEARLTVGNSKERGYLVAEFNSKESSLDISPLGSERGGHDREEIHPFPLEALVMRKLQETLYRRRSDLRLYALGYKTGKITGRSKLGATIIEAKGPQKKSCVDALMGSVMTVVEGRLNEDLSSAIYDKDVKVTPWSSTVVYFGRDKQPEVHSQGAR